MNENIVLPAPASAPVAPPMPKQGLIKLSPLNRRRLKNFKANRRGYWSFWIFVVLFVLSLFAEFLANDKPILVSYKGELLSPVLTEYPEEKFGGFLAVTDYRDPVISKEIEANGWILLGCRSDSRTIPTTSTCLYRRLRLPHGCSTMRNAAPSPSANGGTGCRDIEWNWLGTDDQGRDVVARLIYGFRISVLFGLILAGISSVVGVLAGAVQGYFGGWVDLLFQRFIEIWTAIPALYLLIIISAIITPSFFMLLGILLLFSWVSLVGVVPRRIPARPQPRIRARRARLGAVQRSIMFRHLLPNAMVATLTFLPFILNGSIATLTSLDFLGFGLPPGSPSLGEMLAQGKANLQAPWLGLTGFFVIALMLCLLIFIGEAVRDAFDPRKAFQ